MTDQYLRQRLMGRSGQRAERMSWSIHSLSRQWLWGRVLVHPATSPGGKGHRVALHFLG